MFYLKFLLKVLSKDSAMLDGQPVSVTILFNSL